MPPEFEESLVGTVLGGRYEMLSLVGTGGIGVVYKAKHLLMERIVAIKMLKRHFATDNTSLLRFQQEAKTASNLTHPNVIGVHDFGISDGGLPYLVMDFLEGTSLSDIIRDEGPLPPARVISLFSQSCAGLLHAHLQGVIHRDVKPSNIMIAQTPHGECVKIVDFGMAKLMSFEGHEGLKLTATGDVLGSPLYMSPEQCTGEPLDQRSDVYSLGCSMYETITGTVPLIGKTAMDTMYRHLNEIPPSFHAVRPEIKVPPQLEAVVFKALEKDPRKRFQNMQDFQVTLEKINIDQSSSSLLSMLSRTSRQLRRQFQRRDKLAIVVGIFALILLMAPILYFGTQASLRDPAVEYERHLQAGREALERGDYAAAEEQMSKALKEAEAFEKEDARMLQALHHMEQIQKMKTERKPD